MVIEFAAIQKQTVEAKIKLICALTESREGWEPCRTQYSKWIAEGEVNGWEHSIIWNVCLRYKAENVIAFLLKWIDFQSIKVVPQELYLSFHRTGFLFLYDLTPFIRVISEKWMVDQPHRILNLYDRKEQINCWIHLRK